MRLLGNAVFLASNGARAMSPVSVAILVSIVLRDGLAPGRASLEVDVVDVGASVNDIDINALATVSSVEVLVEGAEREAIAMRDTSQTPWGVLLKLWIGEGMNLLVLLNELNLREI